MADGRHAASAPETYVVIDDPGALKVLSDPLRKRLIELLRQAPSTVKGLAALLQVSPKSLYYHIHLLERHGLIRVVGTRVVSGVLEKHYRATAYLFAFSGLEGATTAPDGAQSRYDAVSRLLAITDEDLRRGVQDGRVDLGTDAAPERALHLAWRLFHLPPSEARAFAVRLTALVEEYAAGYSVREEIAVDGQTYRLLLALFPTYPRGAQAAREGKSE